MYGNNEEGAGFPLPEQKCLMLVQGAFSYDPQYFSGIYPRTDQMKVRQLWRVLFNSVALWSAQERNSESLTFPLLTSIAFSSFW